MFERITLAIKALNAVTEHSRTPYDEGDPVRAELISSLSLAIMAIRGPAIDEMPTTEIVAICTKAIAAETSRIGEI